MEVWTQNSITAPTDKVAIFKPVVRGESINIYDAAIADEKKGTNEETVNLTLSIVL